MFEKSSAVNTSVSLLSWVPAARPSSKTGDADPGDPGGSATRAKSALLVTSVCRCKLSSIFLAFSLGLEWCPMRTCAMNRITHKAASATKTVSSTWRPFNALEAKSINWSVLSTNLTKSFFGLHDLMNEMNHAPTPFLFIVCSKTSFLACFGTREISTL